MELEQRDRPEAEEERQRERRSALNQKKTLLKAELPKPSEEFEKVAERLNPRVGQE
jgi:hypothetical protein